MQQPPDRKVDTATDDRGDGGCVDGPRMPAQEDNKDSPLKNFAIPATLDDSRLEWS